MRTIEEVVEVIRKMPHQFPFSEAEKFTSLLNKRLDEILEIYKIYKTEKDRVLDKIKEDIRDDTLLMDNPYTGETRYSITEGDVLAIIDKYKADKKDCTTCIGFGDKDYAQSFCHDCIKDIQNHYEAESEEVNE